MRSILLTATLIGCALAAPRPQDIDFDAVDAAAAPSFTAAPDNVVSEIAAVSTTAVAPLSAATSDSSSPDRRRAEEFEGLEKRDGNCAAQPAGSGPVPSPDTPDAFLAYQPLQDMANNAPTPYGYTQVFVNAQGSLSAANYMGLHTLTAYDVLKCQSLCDQASGCVAFNMYSERDPTEDPNATLCPNPPSLTNYKCTLWGAPISASEVKNFGQYRDSFQVVITGSNGYNKNLPPPAISNYNGPTELGGAINAPLDNGHNTYMGVHFLPFSQTQGFTPQSCADACTAQTAYDSRHPANDCTYQACTFFNAYVLSKDGIPQGLYCSMYNETWAPKYATNYGQYRGSDDYTVSDSYSYSLIDPPASPVTAAGCTPAA